MIVVDASALVETLLRTPQAPPVNRRLFAASESLHAPHLIDVEIAHILRRYGSRGDLSENRGREAVVDLADLPIHRHRHAPLLPRIWELRNNLTAYDAAYVALAELLDAPLLTRDKKIASAAGHRAVVELI